ARVLETRNPPVRQTGAAARAVRPAAGLPVPAGARGRTAQPPFRAHRPGGRAVAGIRSRDPAGPRRFHVVRYAGGPEPLRRLPQPGLPQRPQRPGQPARQLRPGRVRGWPGPAVVRHTGRARTVRPRDPQVHPPAAAGRHRPQCAQQRRQRDHRRWRRRPV
ncbi:conserved hypothetical protein, partial [Ricinus communis]